MKTGATVTVMGVTMTAGVAAEDSQPLPPGAVAGERGASAPLFFFSPESRGGTTAREGPVDGRAAQRRRGGGEAHGRPILANRKSRKSCSTVVGCDVGRKR